MKKTKQTGVNKYLSRLGLGCVTFGREIDSRTAFQLLDIAVENGITFFDTAGSYGGGASEKMLGSWLQSNGGRNNTLLVATKLLPPYTPANLHHSFNQSMERLRVQSIDLLYLHCWDPQVLEEDTLYLLDQLVASGRVQAIGASNFNSQQLNQVIQAQEKLGLSVISSAQNNNNYAVSDINAAWLDLCRQHQVSTVTYSPLGAGFLTGKYWQGVKLGTRFDTIPGHQDIYFNEASFNRLRRLQEVALQTGYLPQLLALVWALHFTAVDATLIGVRTKTQLQMALEAYQCKDTGVWDAVAELNAQG